MNDANDPTIEPSPVLSNDGTETPPKRIRKRAPQRDVAPQAGTDTVAASTLVRAPDSRQSDDSPGNAEVTLQRGDDAPAPSLAGIESPTGQPSESMAVDGAESSSDRPKRNRRRGRRSKDARDGDSALEGGTESPIAPTHAAPDGHDNHIAQVKEQANQLFGAITSEAFDVDADATDEELQALQARVDAESAGVAQSAEPDAAAAESSLEGLAASDANHAGKPASVPPDVSAASPAGTASHNEVSPAPANAHDDRRVLSPDRDAPKLQKVLAQSGAGSRRDIEQWIVGGRVSVNGQAAHIGQRISFGDRVFLDGKPVHVRIAPLPTRVIAYHKPVGEIVTNDDPEQRPTVFRKLPRLQHGKWQSVGRLDINTEGLLLFTNSGELANQLMHPRFGIDREYAVRVLGTLESAARAKLLEGVDLDGQRAIFKSIADEGGEGVNRWYRVTIAEGRNREVRRLFDAVGLTVSRLIRIRYGLVVLPRGLKRGVWVDLAETDVRALSRLVGHGEPQDRGEGRGDGRGAQRNAGRQDTRRGDSGRGRPGDQAPRDERGRQGRRTDGSGAMQGARDGEQRDGRQARDGFQGGGPGGARGPTQPSAQGPRDQVGRGAQGARGNFSGDRPTRGRGRGSDRRNDGMRNDGVADHDQPLREDGPIPNPLQQTFDKRAIREANRQPRRDLSDDAPIPNPLQQTYDQRALREANRQPRRELGDDGPIPNPLQQNYDKRQLQGDRSGPNFGRPHGPNSGGGGGGGGRGTGRGQSRGPGQGDGGRQPDPMQSATGYIGSDALRAKQARGGRGGGGGGGSGGRGGPGGGGRRSGR